MKVQLILMWNGDRGNILARNTHFKTFPKMLLKRFLAALLSDVNIFPITQSQ